MSNWAEEDGLPTWLAVSAGCPWGAGYICAPPLPFLGWQWDSTKDHSQKKEVEPSSSLKDWAQKSQSITSAMVRAVTGRVERRREWREGVDGSHDWGLMATKALSRITEPVSVRVKIPTHHLTSEATGSATRSSICT